MAEGLTQTADLMHGMAESAERGQKAAKGMDISFGKITASLVAARTIEGFLDKVIYKSSAYLTIEKAFSAENLKQVGIGNLRINTIALAATAMADLLLKQRQFNQNLIEANSSFEHRNMLLKDTLYLQAQSGVSFDRITDAARALVSYGMDAETSFEANLEIIAKMEQGLGVSVSESARLASIVERQVKGSFEGVARTIAQIVEDTALAGDEAARLATNISTALGRLRPGLGAAGLPDVLKLVGRYEGALKEVGGSSGALTQLLTQLTTPEGITGAGTLGVGPEFLATAGGVQEVMQRFSKFGEMLVGQSAGWERQFRLQALAQQFNLSADQANQLMLAIKRGNEQQTGNISLQERWRQQIHATNSGISRLTNAFMGLLQTGLLPVVNVIGAITNKLADFAEFALKSRTVVYVLGTALAVASAVAAAGLWRVVRALSATALVSGLVGVGRSPLDNPLGRALGVAPSLWSRMLVPLQAIARGVGMLLTPLGIIVSAFAAAGVVLGMIYKVNKESRDEQKAAQSIILNQNNVIEERRRSKIYSAVRFGGTPDEVLKAYEHLVGNATQMFQDINDPDKRMAATSDWLKKMLTEVTEMDIPRALVTKGMYTPLTEMTLEEADREDEMLSLTEKMAKSNAEMLIRAERDIKMKQEQAQEMEAAGFTNRAWYNSGILSPLGVASDYYSTLGR